MIDKPFPEGVSEAIYGVVLTVYRRYNKWTERDDMMQEAWAWATSRYQQIVDATSEPDPEIRKHNERRLWWQLKRVCERYARKEKAAKSGYVSGDEYFYETSTLAQMLPHILSHIFDGAILEQAQQLVDDGTPRHTSAPAEGRGLLAMLIDIKRGYEMMEEKDKTLLAARYHENLTLEKVAERFECSTSTADRRCESALRSLQRILGGETPYK